MSRAPLLSLALAIVNFAAVPALWACDRCSKIVVLDDAMISCYLENFAQIEARLQNREPDRIALDRLCTYKDIVGLPPPDAFVNRGIILTPRLVLDTDLSRCIFAILDDVESGGEPVTIRLSDECTS